MAVGVGPGALPAARRQQHWVFGHRQVRPRRVACRSGPSKQTPTLTTSASLQAGDTLSCNTWQSPVARSDRAHQLAAGQDELGHHVNVVVARRAQVLWRRLSWPEALK